MSVGVKSEPRDARRPAFRRYHGAMTAPLRITSPSNPRVKQVVRLRNARDRRKTGLFIAEGMRELTRAVAAGLAVREVFVCPELLGEADARGLPAIESAASVEVTAPVFRKMAYLREPQGVLAVVEQPIWTLERLPAARQSTLYLVTVGIEKPGNLGAMVRTADAAGCDAVLVTGPAGGQGGSGERRGYVDVFNPNAIRASTCAVFALPTVAVAAEAAIHWLSDRSVRVMAATPGGGGGADDYARADWRGPAAVAIGAEDVGLDKAWLAAADRSGGQRVAIPMRGRLADSLNASAAAAVLLIEARRRIEP